MKSKTPTLSCGRAVVSALEGSQKDSPAAVDPILESYNLSSTELIALLNQLPPQNSSAEFSFLKKLVERHLKYSDDPLLSIQYRRSGLIEYCLLCRETQQRLGSFPCGVRSGHSLTTQSHEETDPLLWPMP